MAGLALLSGTNADLDVLVTLDGDTEGTSLKCVAGSVESETRVNSWGSQKTFCSGKWASEAPEQLQNFIRMDKFASQGVPISDPLAMFAGDAPLAITFTATTGCTMTGTYWCERDMIGFRAGSQASNGAVSFRSKDAVLSTWVVA